MSFTKRTVRGQPLRTKIVCTLGPSSREVSRISELIEAGMSVARLNMSHGDHETHRKTYAAVREAGQARDRQVAVMCDLSGPKIRLNEIEGGSFELSLGEKIDFVRGNAAGTPKELTCTYASFVDDVEVDEPVYINDGAIRLNVVKKQADRVTCVVDVGGVISSRKGINLPGTRISSPALTEKDIRDLEFGVKLGADLFALSFVRSAAEVRDLRSRLDALGSSAQIVAKIEKPQALKDLPAIIDASDAIMVARGDLGIELPVESVPLHQKAIVRACRDALKPVIVATQVLESMIEHPTPTRAEVSDIANAIEDGCDALMLSAETASGKFPVQAVETMARVARDVEKVLTVQADTEDFLRGHLGDALRKAMVIGAAIIAQPLGAKFIVVRSESGVTARYLSKVRGHCPVLAVHHDPAVLRRHALMWGVLPVQTSAEHGELPAMEEDLRQLARTIIEEGLVSPADRIVVISRYPWGEQQPPNNIRALRVGDALGALP
ncbi:MAG: pyruvate kinase [Planctomycetes bacterium]|nr:pyruvate kinase [Planctomycetota bacterium]